MNVELNEEGYTPDGKWKLVPVHATLEMGHAYGDDFLYSSYNDMIAASPKPEFKDKSYKRIGDIHIGGEITAEFEQAGKEMWCKSCGSGVGFEDHLPSCPTLANKI